MKKIIETLLCLVLLFATVSCAQKESESFDVDLLSYGSSEGISLEGRNIKYIFNPEMNWAVTAASDSFLGYAYETNLADAAIKRVAEVEKKLDCVITIEQRTQAHDYVKAPILSGVYVTDIVSGISDMIGDYCRLGCYVGMSELSDYIDINDSDKWGTRPFLETMYYKDDLYGLVPAAWPELTHINFGYPIVFNGNIFATNGITDPREYVENNEWTWDKFAEVVAEAHIEEGGEVKHYGFMGAERMIAEMFIFSNGATFVSVNSDGEPYFSLFDEKGQTAMDACNNILNNICKDYIAKYALTYNHDQIAKAFVSEEASMAAIYTGYIYGRDAIVAQGLYDFGILSWPHGPDVADDFTFGVIENIYTAVAIPVTSPDPISVAAVLNELYEPLEGFETRETVQEYMSHNYFFDQRDADTFFRMYDNCIYEYFHWYDSDVISDYIGNQSAIEYVSANKSTVESRFEDDSLPIVEAIISMHGTYSAYANGGN